MAPLDETTSCHGRSMLRPMSPVSPLAFHRAPIGSSCRRAVLVLCLAPVALSAGGCGPASDPQAEAPPPLKLQKVEDRNLVDVDKPERFRLEQATAHTARSELRVT